MIKKLFWLTLGIGLAVFGCNFFKKRAAENLSQRPGSEIADMIVEKLIELFDVIKQFVRGYWQGYSGGQIVNDRELENIFANKTLFDPDADSTTRQSDISLN